MDVAGMGQKVSHLCECIMMLMSVVRIGFKADHISVNKPVRHGVDSRRCAVRVYVPQTGKIS
jgi:hypothetical protein